jgi:glutamate dehydrogenase
MISTGGCGGFTLDAVRTADAGSDPATTIAVWEQKNFSRLSRARATLDETADAGSLDPATLSIAVRALARL